MPPFLSTLAAKLIGGALVIAALVGAYFYWQHTIQHTQQLKDDNAQLTQVIKDIDELKKKTDALDQAQASMLVELNKKNTTVITKQQSIKKYIDSPEARKSDGPAPDILKETVRRLGSE